MLLLLILFMIFGLNQRSSNQQLNQKSNSIDKPNLISKDTSKLYLSIRPSNLANEIPIVYKRLNNDLIIVLKSSEVPDDMNIPSSTKTGDGKDIQVTGATSYVLKSDVPKYGLSESQLFDIALNNFEKLKMPLKTVIQGNSTQPNVAVPLYDDSYSYGEDIVQSNLISEKSLELLKKQLGNEFYVTMSNYETFMAFRKDLDKGHWEIIKNITEDDYNNAPHPLSDKLYLYSNGKLTSVNDVGSN